MKIITFNPNIFENKFDFIHDYYTLAIALKTSPKNISYLLHNHEEQRKKLIKKTPLKKGRISYQSFGVLEQTQYKIRCLLKNLYTENDTQVISYRNGINPYNELDRVVGCKYTVACDIKKYFDNITDKHIVETLQYYGFNQRGAKLIARLATVYTKNGRTLQQGSRCSDVISNLVGIYYFDRFIKQWLKTNTHYKMDYEYIKYCDNLFLGLKGEINYSFITSYKHFVNTIVNKAGFRTHKWEVIPNNHPKRNQRFLGAVLNKVKRIEKDKYLRLRATLFNCCKNGVHAEAVRYWNKYKTEYFDKYSFHCARDLRIEKMQKRLRGQISHIKSINKEQYNELVKLFKAMEQIERAKNDKHLHYELYYTNNEEINLKEDIFHIVKQYKNQDEPVEDFVSRISNAIENCNLSALAA